MKRVIKGGLQSLIPKRDVKDADEVIERLDDEGELIGVGGEEASDERMEVESSASKKVTVIEESEVGDDAGAEETAGDEELAKPSKPLVTPLKIDVDDEDDGEAEESDDPSASPSVSRKSGMAAPSVRHDRAQGGVDAEKWDKHEEDVQHVAIGDIKINPSQPRRQFDPVGMEELASSIEQHGILQPLVVRRRKRGYELIAGERRLRAAKSLGWNRVPCVVRRDVSSDASRIEMALIENIQRQDLNAVEEAMAYKQLNEEYGMTHEEIGQRVGRSRVGVTNTIRVLQLAAEIQRGMIEGKISAGHGRAILMIPDEDKQIRFYRHLLEEGLTVRKAETRARRIQRTMDVDDPMRRKRKGRSAFEIKYSGLLEDRYGYDAHIRFNEVKNRYEVYFKCHSQQEIKELLGRLLGTEPLPGSADGGAAEEE